MKQELFAQRVLPFLAKQTIFIVLAVLILVFSLSSPNFLTGQNIQSVARQISFDAIVALGEVIVLIAGGIDLSVGSVLAISASLTMGLQPAGVGVAVFVALAMGAVVGAIN